MRMKEFHLLNIDHGAVAVIVEETEHNGKTIYIGSIYESDEGIYITSNSVEDCLEKLKQAINVALKFKLRLELYDLNIIYE